MSYIIPGSLMSVTSSLRTMPSATCFRPAILYDYERIFNLVSVSGIRTGLANWNTMEVSALAIRPCIGSLVRGVCFEIPENELASYFDREHRYLAKRVCVSIDDNLEQLDGSSMSPQFVSKSCWTVIEQTDETYRASMDATEWHERVGQYYDGVLWGRDGVLPMREYLRMCLNAAWELGGRLWLHNMLDEARLGDGSTTIRDYVLQHSERFEDLIPFLDDRYFPSSRL